MPESLSTIDDLREAAIAAFRADQEATERHNAEAQRAFYAEQTQMLRGFLDAAFGGDTGTKLPAERVLLDRDFVYVDAGGISLGVTDEGAFTVFEVCADCNELFPAAWINQCAEALVVIGRYLVEETSKPDARRCGACHQQAKAAVGGLI